MSLGSFSRLLTRSFYPRKINRAKVEFSPGIVSQEASMFLIWKRRGVGAVVAAALTGGVGILIFKKRPDDDGMS